MIICTYITCDAGGAGPSTSCYGTGQGDDDTRARARAHTHTHTHTHTTIIRSKYILLWDRDKGMLEKEEISPALNLGMRVLYQARACVCVSACARERARVRVSMCA